MEHPNSKCRIAQAEYLSRLPEEERENKARDIRIGNASYIYHQQAVPIQENRLIMYYKRVVGRSSSQIFSRHMRNARDLKHVRQWFRLRDMWTKRNDIGMRDWMQEHLSPGDFNYWQELRKKQVRQHFNPIPWGSKLNCVIVLFFLLASKISFHIEIYIQIFIRK